MFNTLAAARIGPLGMFSYYNPGAELTVDLIDLNVTKLKKCLGDLHTFDARP